MKGKGFTLIELVMVIVIIGILAAVAIPRFVSLQQEAERARCEADIGAFRTGVSAWYAKYWANNSQCPASGECITSGTGEGFPANISSAGFAGQVFSDGKIPDVSHIVNSSVTTWNATYDSSSGTIDMEACCNRTS